MHPFLKQLLQDANLSITDQDQVKPLLEQVSKYLEALDNPPHDKTSPKDLKPATCHELKSELDQKLHLCQRQDTELAVVKMSFEDSLALLNTTLEATHDALAVFDTEYQLVAHNQPLQELFEITSEQVETVFKGSELKDLLKNSIHNDEQLLELIRFTNENPTEKAQCLLHFQNGRYIDCISKPRFLGDQTVGRVWSLRDITDLKRSEEEARRQAYHDGLTDLPNRVLLKEQMTHALTAAQHRQHKLAILFMDLDGFKYVNDTLGHDFGDLLLCHAAMRLKECTRDVDLLARYGGDEFIIMMDEVESVQEVTSQAESIIEALERPFIIRGETMYMTASIGISLYPNDGVSAENLIRDADMAMYHAKAKGRNNFQFFAKELAVLSSHRLSLRNKLKTAIEEQQFSLLYQPKVTAEDSHIVGVEALIRWILPDGQVIPPDEFISAAEDNGLIIPIGDWVFEQAIKQAKEWTSITNDKFTVAVNVSARQFQQVEMVDNLIALLKKYDLPANHIELEITESMVMGDIATSIATLKKLQGLGVRIAIDDFGTGYSSLGYLKSLPVDCLKIDKSFVDALFNSKADRAMVSTIIYLSHVMGVQVVAEGVEDEESLKLLNEMTCDIIQGYYFSRPVPAEQITDMLTNK